MKSTKTLIFLTALLFASSCSKPDINLAHKTTQAVIRAETIEEARAVGSKAAEDAYNEYMDISPEHPIVYMANDGVKPVDL